MPVADEARLLRARQVFLFRIGVLPQYHPKTGTDHGEDTGTGHTVTFYDIPLMGPNRIGTVGQEMSFDGHVTYARVGGTAHDLSWKVYKSSSETLGDGDLVHSHSGTTMDWTPDDDGIYRVELRTGNRKSDGSTDGARFVRVFPDYRDSDLSKSVQINGNFSVESGGYEATITYKPLQPGETTEVDDWARIVIQVIPYYTNTAPTLDDAYVFQSDEFVSTGNPPSSDVFLNGIVLEDSIQEDRDSETVTFKIVSPGYALQKLPMKGYTAIVNAPQESGLSVPLQVEYPLMYGDPTHPITLPDMTTIDVVSSIRQNDANFPVHEVPGMTFSDPIYHTIQQHTNYAQWWDVYLEQAPELHPFPYAMAEGSVWSQLKKFQDARLGVLYCSKKGVLYFSRDIRFQDDAWWGDNVPDVVMHYTRDNVIQVRVQHTPYRVAQVQLSGTDDQGKPLFARFPDVPDTIGEIIKRTGVMVFDQATISSWAGRMYSIMNQPDDVSITALGIQFILDLQDVVGVEYTDRAGIRTV